MSQTNLAHLVQLTAREPKLFRKLNAAGWLTTLQIREYFFPGKSSNAVCKRLRKLVAAGYLASAQVSSTELNYYRLSSRGKRYLEDHSNADELISVPVQLPRKLHHFTAVNELRLTFETAVLPPALKLEYFHSEREYPLIGRSANHPLQSLLPLLTQYQLIPDAIAGLRLGEQQSQVALEYDAGTEPAHYFGRRKMQAYLDCWRHAPQAFAQFRLLVVVPTLKRLLSLMRQTAQVQPSPGHFFFALLKKLKSTTWMEEVILLDPTDYFVVGWEGDKLIVQEKPFKTAALPRHALAALLATSPRKPSPREEKDGGINPSTTSYLPKKQMAHY